MMQKQNSNLDEHFDFSGMLNSHGCCSLKCHFLSLIVYFIYLLLVAPGLGCCVWAVSSCGPAGLLWLWCVGFSLWQLLLFQGTGSRRRGFSSCGMRSQFLYGILPPRPGIEPMSPALAGGFLSVVSPGKSHPFLLNRSSLVSGTNTGGKAEQVFNMT